MSGIVFRRLLWVATALVLAAALASSGAAGARAEPGWKVHPAVSVYEQQNPGQKVPVIVRVREGEASRLSRSVDGSRALPLVDGFAAMASTAEVRRLAADPAVQMVSLDAVMTVSDWPEEELGDGLATVYPFAANAVPAWGEGVTGEGVTVAVIDTGVSVDDDFRGRLAGRFSFSEREPSPVDLNGHGTHVAGVIAGEAEGYVGIAPGARLLSLKVGTRQGAALASDVIEALQWAVDHRDEYGIRVVNISLTSTLADSYVQDPLDAAVEQAWFHGIVVVVAAGNYGSEAFAVDHAPANDPYVITVGAFDDAGTVDSADDRSAQWSARGVTVDGYAKPEVMAPGRDIVATLAGRGSYLASSFPEAVVDGRYLRLSGTSSSAAVVSGVVALMLEEEPGLTPDEVKFRLMQAASPGGGWEAPRVDAYGTVFSAAMGEANGSAVPSDLIDPATGEILYDSVLWSRVLWSRVLWSRVLWSSVLWSR